MEGLILIRNYLILCAAITLGVFATEFLIPDHKNIYAMQIAGWSIAEWIGYGMGRILFYWILPRGLYLMYRSFTASAVLKQQQNSL